MSHRASAVAWLPERSEASVMRPGFEPARLVRLMHQAVKECALNLRGRVVLTEAATGAYAATPILAALAGAEVIAVTKSTRYGLAEEVKCETLALAALAGVADRISVVFGAPHAFAHRADIITNSGHVRPIDAAMVSVMKAEAVVPLMFEAWEIQAGRFDVDLDALAARGIAFAGTNERHPHVDVFSYLGMMAIKLLLEAGIPVYRARIAVLCDNPFASYLEWPLRAVGATVSLSATLDGLIGGPAPDALLVAQRPRGVPELSNVAERIASVWPGTTVAQFWGDIDRHALLGAGVPFWPPTAPGAGHMSILPSDIGPEAIVRLQAGGLKVGETLLKPADQRTKADRDYLDEL